MAVLSRLFLRPSLFLAIITIIAYWDQRALNGGLVYDDGGSLKNNVVVAGNVPWHEVFRRDFWGTLMSEPQSHKSFRPITTLTFRANWILAGNEPTANTFGFHLVNVILHGIVTGLTVEVSSFLFPQDMVPQIIVGAIFGLHPVHAEAVTNITSRGELLMSFFFLVAFLFFANSVHLARGSFFRIAGVYVMPWVCMFLSTFCKEQGATALVSIVVYDFFRHHTSVQEFFARFRTKEEHAIDFLRRTILLGVQSAIVVGFRVWLNGESSPDFIYDQNPAGFAKERFTRMFSVSWVYCLYIRDAVYPVYLAPDWSGLGIDLIESIRDPRALCVIALWVFTAGCLYSLFFGRNTGENRKILLIGFFGLLFAPFLLSSNLLVVTGLMKADRVIYLPLLGFAVLQALLFQNLSGSNSNFSSVEHRRFLLCYILLMAQFLWLGSRLHERNVAWSNSLDLWVNAYLINNRSHHTMVSTFLLSISCFGVRLLFRKNSTIVGMNCLSNKGIKSRSMSCAPLVILAWMDHPTRLCMPWCCTI